MFKVYIAIVDFADNVAVAKYFGKKNSKMVMKALNHSPYIHFVLADILFSKTEWFEQLWIEKMETILKLSMPFK